LSKISDQLLLNYRFYLQTGYTYTFCVPPMTLNGGLSSLFTKRKETPHYFPERTEQLASFPGLHAPAFVACSTKSGKAQAWWCVPLLTSRTVASVRARTIDPVAIRLAGQTMDNTEALLIRELART